MRLLNLCLAAVVVLGSCTGPTPPPAAGEATATSGIRRPTSCPRCRSRDIVEVVYGRLGPEGQKQVLGGLIVSGGCEVDRENPDWHCRSCRNVWYDASDPQRKAAWDAFEREMQEIYDRADAKPRSPTKPQQPASAPRGDRG